MLFKASNFIKAIRAICLQGIMARVFKKLKTCQQEFKIQVSELRDHIQVLPQEVFFRDHIAHRAMEEALRSKGWFPLGDGSYVCPLLQNLEIFKEIGHGETEQCLPQFLAANDKHSHDLIQIYFRIATTSTNSISMSFTKIGNLQS
jgi:hypothetical protein